MGLTSQRSTRLAWLTGIHLIFTWDPAEQRFDPAYHDLIKEVRETNADGVLLSGDIAEAPELLRYLRQLESDLTGLPIYFILGNHDFYRGSIDQVREEVTAFASNSENLIYLTASVAPIALTERVGLIGHDGLADGRFGELEWSRAKINDLIYIEELRDADEAKRKETMNGFGDEAANHFRVLLGEAVRRFKTTVLLTHVPPWLPLAIYNDRPCDYEYAPYFASKAAGQAIEDVMRESPSSDVMVLCEHTHCAAEYRPLTNIHALAGLAEYDTPRLQPVIEL